MYGLRNMLLEEQAMLESIIEKTKENMKMIPEGYLRISKDKSKIRYYHCTRDNKGIYIPKGNQKLPRQLAQKTYDASVIQKAEKRIKQIKRILGDYKDDEMEQLYTSLKEERKTLIYPVVPSWNQLLEEWLNEEYKGKDFAEGIPVIMTERGERVRSKSEKIIADYLFRRNIPYKYEKPLRLEGYGIVYPDFSFLSKKTRKEVYWEHEGMLDKQEYARNAVKKIELYQKNGIYIGERLILTFETEQSVLSSNMIEKLVNKYLLEE